MSFPTTDLFPRRSTTPTVNFEAANATQRFAQVARLIPVGQNEGLEIPVTPLVDKGVLEALTAVGATGKHGEITRVVVDSTLYIAFGLGMLDDDGESNPRTGFSETSVRRAVASAARSLKGVDHAVIGAELGVRPIVEGLVLGGYVYNGFKSTGAEELSTAEGEKLAEAEGIEPAVDATAKVTVLGTEEQQEEFDAALTIAQATGLARDLVNTPANYLFPASYADIVADLGRSAGLTVEVLDESALAEQGFGGILAVGQGSARPPRLVHLSWAPADAERSVALVGKGVTFDTGGISIKPAAGMDQMVMDMGGSAAVCAAVLAAAQLNLPVRVDAWMALAENMPSGSAQRPGDVITHYGGITSEVLNTDAEGRLVLADAIARASEENPDDLIEVSTLTGAQMVALGKRTFAVMGTDELRDRIADTARELDEPAWAMPLLEEHEEEIASKVADLRNIGGDRYGGMEYAGTYLSRFVADGINWAHLDIASPAWNSGAPYGITPARATGVPVRTLIEVLRADPRPQRA
ncbi:leucyl aminopeptidase [Corynebacterium aquatimens]|uniref:Probable cytosol aminopeptidase n=1 Tax=Corynebacterium aquatimens TaxID=1190508 RepID=A0A931E3U8_9CORY|nr:leucyl aminopeptidase [Corynebacterium aquatimens]MBG6121998.1 leucyl aminopeptidase [Corynebacterium aquatimens]WJY65463.1 Cytosol aminopeptidase [Corynebacterium aquatimens]